MPLTPPEILIWQLGLDLPAAEIEVLSRTLSADEAARARGYRLERDCRRFVAARGQLRTILGRTLNCQPREVVFGYTPFGKPSLCGNPDRLRFNLSHADDLALVALAWDCEVGIDIERIRPDIAIESLAARFLPSAEAAALPPEDRPRAFFQAWTRHEAYLKARGTGFAAPPDAPPFDPACWSRHDLEVGAQYQAALVAAGPGATFLMQKWGNIEHKSCRTIF